MGIISKKGVLSNFLWRFFERSGTRIVSGVVSILLARKLAPELFGTIALVTIFVNILQVFVDSGLGNALIQKKDADDVDFSTVFYFNLAFCALLYSALFFTAPLIALFYKNEALTPIIRVLGLTLIVSGVRNVQQAYVSRNMLFRFFFFATLGGTIGSAVVGLTLAYLDFGVWTLVAQQLFSVIVGTIILWTMVKWRPLRVFSLTRLKGLFSFGWKLLVSSLIDIVYQDLRQLIIGYKYTRSDLAFYNRASQLPQSFTSNINSSIDSVLFPAMSSVQDDKLRVKSMTRRAMKTSTYVMAPLLMGLAACGKSVVVILLTEKWLPCVPYLVIFCITNMFLPIHTANLNAIKAMGRSDLFLKLEIIKKVVGLTAILLTMNHGVMAMAYSLLVTNVLSQLINSWPNKKLMNYSYLEQLKDILPGILLAACMGLIVYSIDFAEFSMWLTLFLQVPLGIVIYLIGSKIFKLDSFEYLCDIVRGYLKKRVKAD